MTAHRGPEHQRAVRPADERVGRAVDPAELLRAARLEAGRRSRLTRDELAREDIGAAAGRADPNRRTA